jgi:hypothetical protein
MNNSNENNNSLLMPYNQMSNNIYEQILQRNLAILNQQQQQQQSLFLTNLSPTQQQQQQQQTLLEYQLRYRTLINTAQNYSPYTAYQPSETTNNTLFQNNENCRLIKNEEPKPTHSYIGLISLAILSTPEKKIVLSDIYQWILDNYLYFRNRGAGWRNSIRHNLSLNDCFVKCGRSVNGKGHYWSIHPANLDDFSRGDFRRRRAQRRVRKSLGLTVPEEEEDDDEYEAEEEEYDDDIAVSSSVSLIKNCKRSAEDDSSIPEKRIKKTCHSEKLKDSSSAEDTISTSEHSVSEYNTTADEIDDSELTVKEILKQKRCFDVDTLLAPDCKKFKNTDYNEFDDSKTKIGVQLDSTTNISTSSSASLSSSSVSSSPIPPPTTTTVDSNSSLTDANINQSLLNATTLYRNYCMFSNNPLFFYQVPTTTTAVLNTNNGDSSLDNTSLETSAVHEEVDKTIKEKIAKKISRSHHRTSSKNNECSNRAASKQQSASSKNDVEKWNQTFSKIMARSYKNHNTTGPQSLSNNSKVGKSLREGK